MTPNLLCMFLAMTQKECRITLLIAVKQKTFNIFYVVLKLFRQATHPTGEVRFELTFR